jgi:DNA-binding NarL/FixJ family response regulator
MGSSGLLPAPIRIVVIDRSAVFVAALRRFLDLEPGLEIVAHAFSSMEAITLVAQLRPDLVLMDMSMAQFGGLDLIRLLRRGARPPLIIAIAFFREYESHARESGVDGFVSKAEVDRELAPLARALIAARRRVDR